MRYPYIVAAGCLTLLLSTEAGARPANLTASALSNIMNVQMISAELPSSKPDGKKGKRHHGRRHREPGPRGHQTPLPGEDTRDDCGQDTPAPTPEPGTLLLVGAAAGAMGLRRRFRSRNH